jgi:transposase
MAKQRQRVFTAGFKADAVRMARAGDRTGPQVAEAIGVSASVLRAWLSKAPIHAPEAPGGALADAERRELLELRREVRTLREDREILQKAASFFAKESR